MPARINLTGRRGIHQGDTRLWHFSVVAPDDAVVGGRSPVDLTGAQVTCTVREASGGRLLWQGSTRDQGVTVVTGSFPGVQVEIPAEATTRMLTGNHLAAYAGGRFPTCVYDVQIDWPSGRTTTVAVGLVEVSPGVTR